MQTAEREIILDTETTGLKPEEGHRLIEIAAVEIIGTEETGRIFHRLYDPGREIDPEATNVHGHTWQSLKGKPLFEDEAAEFARFIEGATLVIHNAPFDVGFLKAEFGWAGVPFSPGKIIDTLNLAKRRWPNNSNSLDALCDRLGVDRTARNLHGALIDVHLLTQVYIRMLGRDQLIPVDLPDQQVHVAAALAEDLMPAGARQSWFPERAVREPAPEELERHLAFLAKIKGETLWSKIQSTEQA